MPWQSFGTAPEVFFNFHVGRSDQNLALHLSAPVLPFALGDPHITRKTAWGVPCDYQGSCFRPLPPRFRAALLRSPGVK